jgi:hypothetical protein
MKLIGKKRKKVKSLRTSQIIQSLAENELKNSNKISVEFMIEYLHHRGFGFLCLIFALPTCFPVIPPGIPTIFAIPIIYFAFQILLNFENPYIPKSIAEKQFPTSSLRTLMLKSVPYFKAVEKLFRPRMTFLHDYWAERVLGFFILIMAIIIALPLPLGNIIPSIAIVLVSLGIIEKDGLVTLIGYVTGIIGAVIVIWFAETAIHLINKLLNIIL